MKRIIMLVLCVIVLISAIYVSINHVKSTDKKQVETITAEPITLKLWHIWAADSESSKKPFEKILSDWNSKHPFIKIEAEATENEAYKMKIRTVVASNEMPDIFFTWGAGFAKPFVESGKVMSINDYINDGTKDKLLPNMLEHFTYNGKIYSLPTYITSGIFYYNNDIFKNNSIKIPENFNELLEAVKTLKQKGIVPITVGEKDRWPGMFYHNIIALRTAGVEKCKKALKKEESFDQEVFIESAKKLDELIKAGAFDIRYMNMTRDEAEEDFKNGKVAMYYNGSWFAGALEKDDCMVKGKVVARNFPVIDNNNTNEKGVLGGAIDCFMIAANTQHKNEAVEALKTISYEFCKESYIEGVSQPAWKLDVDKKSQSPLAQDIANMLDSSNGFVLAWDTFLSGTDAEIHKDLVAKIFTGSLSGEDFAKEMQKLNEK